MSDMTEQNAPERIWAWDDPAPMGRHKGWSAIDAFTGSTEYVRADLYDAANAEIDRLSLGHQQLSGLLYSKFEVVDSLFKERAEKAEAERDAAIKREKSLLASNDEDRKGLVEAASLRHRLKVMTAERDAAWNEAIEAAAAASGHHMSDEADELLLDMWRESIRALRREARK